MTHLSENKKSGAPLKRITILLAEDHTIVREGFRMMLAREVDFEIVGEAKDGRRAVLMASELCPDIILMDIAMPLLNGLEATRQILKNSPSSKVIILSAHSDDSYVKSAIESGVAGFLLKHASSHEVYQAIRKVKKGDIFFSPSISKRLDHAHLQSPRHTGLNKKNLIHLTSREIEVLQLIAEGRANKQTADELSISIKTVEKHRGHLMEKLNIHDTASLTRYAMENGIIELPKRQSSFN